MATLQPAAAYAQRDSRHECDVVSLVNNEKATASDVQKALEENAPKSPNDNGLPRFTIIGKDGMFYMGIGAQFLGEAMMDWGDYMPSPVLFIPSALQAKSPGNGASTRFGWQTSSIYLNIVALPATENQIGLFFKGTFLGNNNNFTVYHFYGKYRGLTAGYTYSAFTDTEAQPMTLDFQGPDGYPSQTLFTAYWTQKFGNGFSGTIGLDSPQTGITTDATTGPVSQRIPSIPLNVRYAWHEGTSHVRLSAIYRPMQYRDLRSEKNRTISGYGIQLSGMTKIVGPLSVSYNAAYGEGIGSYLQDEEGLNLDAVSVSRPGVMKGVKSMGLTGGLNYAFSPKVSSNLVYSHLTNWLPDGAVTDDTSTYRYGDYVAANVIYNINRFISAGLEYDYGHRKSIGGESLHANRLQCQLAITF